MIEWLAVHRDGKLHLTYRPDFVTYRRVDETNVFELWSGQIPHDQAVLALKRQFPSAFFSPLSVQFEVSDADLILMKMHSA